MINTYKNISKKELFLEGIKEQSCKKYISIDISEVRYLTNITSKNAFYLYVTLLSKYNDNIIHNATYNKLEILSGVSKNSLRKYINILTKWGYIEQLNDKSLKIIPQKKSRRVKFKLLYIYRSLKFNDIKDIIQLLIIDNNILQQKYVVFNKVFSKYYSNRIANKMKKLFASKREEIVGEKIFLSTRSLGKVLGVSHQTVSLLLRKSKKKKFIEYSDKLKLFKKNIKYSEFRKLIDISNKLGNNIYYRYINSNMYIHCGITINSNFILSKTICC